MTHHPRLIKHVIPNYIIYMGLFIGTGFLSGSLVHLPLNPVRFTIIGLIGAAIFVASSTINELTIMKREATHAEIAKLIIYSILLALGVGMISGGVQHFDEVPVYASRLIPLGIILSLAGFVLKNGINLHRTQTVKLAAAALAFVAVLGTGLTTYAQSMTQGEEAPSTQQTDTTPVPTQTEAPAQQQTPPVTGDGHGHGH